MKQKERVHEFYKVKGTGYEVVEVSATSRKEAERKIKEQIDEKDIVIYRGVKNAS